MKNIFSQLTKAALAAAFVFFATAAMAQQTLEFEQVYLTDDENGDKVLEMDDKPLFSKLIIPVGVEKFKISQSTLGHCEERLLMQPPEGYYLRISGTVQFAPKATDYYSKVQIYGTESDAIVGGFITNWTRIFDKQELPPTTIQFENVTCEYKYMFFNPSRGSAYVKTFIVNAVVEVIPKDALNLTVESATNGSVTVSPAYPTANDKVTITAQPDDGYVLQSLTITDADGSISVSKPDAQFGDISYYTKPATFNMRSKDITVTPVFIAKSDFTVAIPHSDQKTVTIPEGLTAFKVRLTTANEVNGTNYPSDNTYANNNNGTLLLTTSEDNVILVKGTCWLYNGGDDYLAIYDGSTVTEDKLLRKVVYNSLQYNYHKVGFNETSTANNLLLQFVTDWHYTPPSGDLADVTITVLDKSGRKFISNLSVAIANQTYTGSAIEPVIEVKDGETTLEQGTDYTVTLPDGGCTDAGSYSVTISGLGEYLGSVDKMFIINPKALTANGITVDDIPTQTYTGSSFVPTITVKDGNTELTKGKDYIVVYSDNKNVGTAKVTITGKDNYSGKVEKTFEIVSKETTLGALSLSEDQNGYSAKINGNYTGSETFTLGNDIAVNSVSFSRTFTANQYSTIILPFDVPNAANCGLFYSFDGVKHEGDAWIAQVTPVTEIKANTPYLFKPSTATPDLTKDVKKLVATTSIIPENDKWDFVGMYQYKEWAEDADKDYGFAGEEDGDIQIGEFVKVGAGASINPFRCYLTYKGTNNDLSKSAVELPDRIIVRVTDPDATDDDSNTEIITPVSEITAEDGIKVWSYNHTAYISAQPGMEYRIVDMGGRTIRQGVTASNREEVSLNGIHGIAIVKIGNKTFKIKY